jgi:hypothetical protein
MQERTFAVIYELARQIEAATEASSGAERLLAAGIRLIGNRGIDPFLLIGVLVEGAAHTLATHIPPEQRAATATELIDMLVDWCAANGVHVDYALRRR